MVSGKRVILFASDFCVIFCLQLTKKRAKIKLIGSLEIFCKCKKKIFLTYKNYMKDYLYSLFLALYHYNDNVKALVGNIEKNG